MVSPSRTCPGECFTDVVQLLRGAHAALQVPRILNPVVLVLDALPKHCKDPKLASYVNSVFGSVEGCRKAVLLDFFRHAFDGSGADNFVSACYAPHPAAFRLANARRSAWYQAL